MTGFPIQVDGTKSEVRIKRKKGAEGTPASRRERQRRRRKKKKKKKMRNEGCILKEGKAAKKGRLATRVYINIRGEVS